MATNTPNYNLDKYEATDIPNLLDQYNASMDKIDTAMKGVENQAVNGYSVANEAKQQATEAQKAATAAQTNASEALQQVATKAQINHASADATYGAASDTMYGHVKLYTAKGANVDGSMTQAAITEALGSVVTKVNTDDIYDNAVTTDKIADGAVTESKLDSSLLASIISGMQIRFFNSGDPNADNDGLQTISGVTVAGFYIVQLEMLVLTNYQTRSVEVSPAANIVLPNYVKRPAAAMGISGALLLYASGQDYKTWTGLTYEPTGKLHPNSQIPASDSSTMFGTPIMCMRNTAKSLASSPVSNYYAQNGVYHG